MMTAVRLGLWLLLVGLPACDRAIANIDFERMIDQEKYDPYEECEYFDDRRAMRTPPRGTVPRTRIVGQPALTEGMVAGQWVETIPVAVDDQLLARGRERFEIFCAACHGILGYGNQPVIENMRLVKPPSLHEPRIVEFHPGRIYRIIKYGYGLMPSYAEEISLADRWAVVAYLQALQRSRAVPLDALPPDLQEEAREVLP